MTDWKAPAVPAESTSADFRLDSSFRQLESLRQQTMKSVLLAGLGLVVCLLLAIAPVLRFEFSSDGPGSMSGQVESFMGQPMEDVGELAAIAIFIWLPGWVGAGFWMFTRLGQRRLARYRQQYKAEILTALCQAYFPEMQYQADAGMPWKILDDSGLFPFNCDAYHSEDRFHGRWGSTEVNFAEAEATRQRTKLRSDGLESVTETYFRGLIFIADFHKHFQGTTRIIPSGEDCRRSRNEERAAFEDPHFESLYETWTSNQSEVRYLLSSSMLHRFTALHSRFPKLRARFFDEKLLLLLPGHEDRFEPSLLQSADSQSQLKRMAEDLHVVLSVVDELNLNTRIWSKV